MKYLNLAAGLLALLPVAGANAAAFSVDAFGDPNEVFHFRDVRSVNSVGFSAADRLTFGVVSVLPNGKNGTTATASQGGVTVNVGSTATTVSPNQMATSVPYNPGLTGSWAITFRNGADTLTVNTPAPGAIGNTAFASNVRQVTGGVTPTFHWDSPAGVDTIKVSIYDLQNRNATSNLADRILVRTVNADQFTVPAGLLQAGQQYSIAISADFEYQGGINPSGSSQAGAIRSRSRAFFDFAAVNLPGSGGVFVPMVNTSGPVPVFSFNNPVQQGVVNYYDPIVAVGYDYEIGQGDPLFASVVLPDIGDGVFDLYLDDGTGYSFSQTILEGDEFFFDAGVDKFRILGIEPSANLDPADANAFATGLSFAEDGQFTGTMTPITQDTAAIPLPPTMLLGLAGIGLLGLLKARRG